MPESPSGWQVESGSARSESTSGKCFDCFPGARDPDPMGQNVFLIPEGFATIAQCFNIGKDQGNGGPVPKGRLRVRAPFQPSLRGLDDLGADNPTLKRWAIVACPSGTGDLWISPGSFFIVSLVPKGLDR